ncbi:hypothetical protein PMAYCL1PPCAC_10232 [Pristionchus mayeri]|uniref:G protein-coupled receptor n=1 Tax=Pristionchus mayeri TaxID=1317129 RepID=A0AAN5CDY3_9BILA|nr:hypothetical protein PMAYCL1PPCAC_10232 [Pristionchus mayeri]
MHNPFAHLLMLNSSIFSQAPSAFYAIRAVDLSIHIFDLILIPFSILAVLRAGVMHRNFRLQICFANLYYAIGCLSRFMIVYYEFNDMPVREDDYVLFAAEVARTFVLDYFCTIVYSLSVERTVALHFWSWYERGSPSTLLVLIFVELLSLVPDIALPYISRLGVISHFPVFIFQVAAWTTSILVGFPL